MDRYILTYEGMARFRRIEIRAHSDPSSRTEDYNILHYIYEHGAATTDEIVSHTGLSSNNVVNRLFILMNRGYIEASVER